MGTIASLAVSLTANISGYSANMAKAGQTLTGIRAGFASATSAAANFDRFINSVGTLKIAGAETITSLRAVLATAKAEVSKFTNTTDVQVVAEIAREHLSESWIAARSKLQSAATASGIIVAATIVSDKAKSFTAWLGKQRQRLTQPLMVRLNVATEKAQSIIAAFQTKLESLKKYRAVRIALTAINAVTPIAAAAVRALVPLTRLAARGIVVAIHATAAGVTAAVAKAKSALGSLGGFANKLISSLTSGFGLLGAGIVAGTGAGFLAIIRGSMESIAATARLSDRLGIATDALGGLQHAAKLAGIENEQLAMGLQFMLRNLSEAANQAGPARDAIARMGLDAKNLANSAPDAAFRQIAQGLKDIKNPADRTRAAVALFGRSGAELLPLLMRGSQGIAAAQAEAQKLGITFNRLDAAKVEQANEAMTRLGEVFTGAIQQIAIKFAPFIEAAATKLVNLATAGRGATGIITDGFGTVLKVVASLSDYLAIVEAGWNGVRAGASYAIGGILNGVGYLIDGINKVTGLLHIAAIGGADDLHRFGQAFIDTGNDAAAAAGANLKQFADGTNAKAAARAIQDIQNSSDALAGITAKNASAMLNAGDAAEDYGGHLDAAAEGAKKITDTLEDLNKEVATFGMTEGDKKLFDLKSLGASPDQIAQAQKAVDQLKNLQNAAKATDVAGDLQKQIDSFGMSDAQKKLNDLKLPGVDPATIKHIQDLTDKLDALNAAKKKMEEQQSEAKSIVDATRTPMEKYESQIGKLSDLLQSGAIDWTTYGRAVQQARQQLEETGKASGPAFMQAGSAAAQEYAYDNSRGATTTKVDADSKAIAKMSYNEQYQSRLYLQQITNQLTDSNADATQTVSIT